jgi:hypothetical protein
MTATTTNVPGFRPTPTPDDITEVLTATGGPTVAAAEALAPRIDYDVDGALRAGLTAKNIAEDLARELNYDIAAAREAGVTDDQIINELSTARMPSRLASTAEGTARGAVVGLPTAGAAATGIAIGAPAGPAGMFIGGALGTIIGLFAGTMAEQGLEDVGILSDAPLVPGRRPFLEGGRTFGGGAALLPASGLAVRGMPLSTTRFLEIQTRRPRGPGVPGERVTPSPLDRILASAQQRPGLFAAGETSALGAAAVGAGLAEAADPGNEYLRMGAEIALGMVNPVGIITRFGPAIRDGIMASLQSLTPEGRANRLGTKIVDILENAGEDPQAVIRALMQDDEIAQLAAESGVDLGTRTAALRSGSPTLTTLQRTSAAENQQLGPTVARAAEQNLEGIARLINLMSTLEDPAILAVAARMRDDYFRDALQMRLDQATARASETAGRLITEDPLAGQRAGEAVASIVGDALSDARAQERALYGGVILSMPASADNIIDTAAQIRGSILPESPFPSLITRFVRRVSGEDLEEGELPDISLRDITNFRSEMLSMARDARATGNFRDANFYGRMAEAALDDIGLRAGETGRALDPNQQSLANAYAFSRSLNDVFTRSFAGDVGATRRTGADRIPPELLAGRIFGSGGDATSLRIAQLEEAAQFLANNAGPEFAGTAAQRMGTLRDAEQTILRVAAGRTLNPETGQVNTVALARFLRENAATLEKFPALRADLEDAITAQQRLRNVTEANTVETRALENDRVFGALLGAEETPGGAVGMAIGTPGEGRRPDAVRNLNQLIKLANTAGDLAPQARAGLRDAVLDRAIVYATSDEGGFSFNRFRNFLMEPISRSQPSVAGVLRDGGIFTDVELTQLNRLLTEFDNIQSAIDAGGPRLQEKVIDAPAVAFDAVTRVLGTGLGTGTGRFLENIPGLNLIYRRGGGQGLIEAQIGSGIARNMFSDMPQTYFRDMLNEAITRPEVMADFLQRGVDRSSRRGRQIDRRINAFLINAGLQPARQEIEDITRAGITLPFGAAQAATPDPAVLEQYLQSLQQAAPAPAIPAAAPQPAPATLPAGAPPPAAPAAVPTAPRAGGQQGRASYAALFPNDPIAPIVQQREIAQGIGSLMGGPR